VLKSFSLAVCASLVAFAGSAFAAGTKEKITCHHGALATFQLDMDWGKGTATISERIKGQWVPTYRNATIVRSGAQSKAFLAEGTPAQAVQKSSACGRVDQTLSFDIQDVGGKRVGSASRAFAFVDKAGGKRCKVKAPPPDLADYAITLKCN
jgi:hypothetical protein